MQTTSLKEKWRFLKSCISSNKHHMSTFDTTTAKGINVTFWSDFKAEDIDQFDIGSYFSTLEQQTHYTIEIFETFNLLRSITRFATGPDGVSGLIYKSFAEFLAEPLTILFNFSTSQYIIPTLWKQAIVLPIPKSNNEHRRISLLCHPAKILEKLVLSK
jgi:hypothetical protein